MIFSKDLLFNGTIVKWRNGEILIYNKQEDSLYNIKDLTKPVVFFNLNYDDNLLFGERKKSERDIVAFNNSPALIENIDFENWRFTRLTKEDFLIGLGYKTLQNDPFTFYLTDWWVNPDYSFKVNFKDEKYEVVSRKSVFNGEAMENLQDAFDEVKTHYQAAIDYESNGKDKFVEYGK